MIVLGVDFETTGLNTGEDHIIEVGAMLWDTDRNVPMNPVLSSFINPGVEKLPEIIVELTGITDADLANHGYAPKAVLQGLVQLMNKADACVAHNGNLFDRPMLESNAKRHGVEIPKKLWIDTSTDIEFPPTITTRKLVHLAAEHGFVNPFAHRAIFDVGTMLQVAKHYDWAQIKRYAETPTLVVRADVTYHQRELAKKRNYRFQGETKTWIKSIKEFQLDDERAGAREAGFTVSVLSKGAV
jgi:DNA polymerase-3 subunit epsilon